MSCQGAGVDAGDSGDTVAFEIGVDRADGAPVARVVAAFADDETGDPRAAGFVVVIVDAVVADEGVGHADDLATEGGVGADLLIPGHGGGEDGLAFTDAPGAEPETAEDAAVGESEGGIGAWAEGPCFGIR